jgi:hypothetical protein
MTLTFDRLWHAFSSTHCDSWAFMFISYPYNYISFTYQHVNDQTAPKWPWQGSLFPRMSKDVTWILQQTRCISSFSVKIVWVELLLMSTSSETSQTVRPRFTRMIGCTFRTWPSSITPLTTKCTAYTVPSISLLQHLKRLNKSFHEFHTEVHANALLFKILHASTCKNRTRHRRMVHSTACTWWLTDVIGQVWGYCLRSPLHSATVTSHLCQFAGIPFNKFNFLLDRPWICM